MNMTIGVCDPRLDRLHSAEGIIFDARLEVDSPSDSHSLEGGDLNKFRGNPIRKQRP